MAYITCPQCQHEFLLNQEETRASQRLEDRIHELEHSERVNNLESNQLKHSNRLVDLESEVDALRRFVKASGRVFPRAEEEELEELRGREEFDQKQGWFEEQLKRLDELDQASLSRAWQEIAQLKDRIEDIERAAAGHKSHINALREDKTIKIADLKKLGESELRERIEQLENALNDVSDEDQERIARLEGRVKQIENSSHHWGDKASAAREEAIEDRVERLERHVQVHAEKIDQLAYIKASQTELNAFIGRLSKLEDYVGYT